jgi:hypothetical protein
MVTYGSSGIVQAEVRAQMASTELLAGAAMAFGRGGVAGKEKREEREDQ